MKKIYAHRFGPVFAIATVAILISFITRIVLLFASAKGFDFTFLNIIGVFGIGLFYDLAFCSFLLIPFVLHIALTSDKIYQKPYCWIMIGVYLIALFLLFFTNAVPKDYNTDLKKGIDILISFWFASYLFLLTRSEVFRNKWRTVVLKCYLFLVVFLLLFNAISEFFFWEEFSNRYNFIAVDYLVYSNEVIGNIQESYPIVWIVLGIAILAIAVFIPFQKYIAASVRNNISLKQKTLIAVVLFLLPLTTYLFLNNRLKRFSNNEYANELSGNGLYEFGAAFWNNELDFYKFYQSMPNAEAFSILKNELNVNGVKFTSNDTFNIEREITYTEPEKKMNVVLISVESFSGDFMKAFGNTQNITPVLDSLAQHSLFFTNFYASGTRTVRGLEALSLAIPPTPGQSIVKRPKNDSLFSLGSVFKKKGYITQYLYGGYSYFDNMKTFFGGNDYDVIDRSALAEKEITFANIWGVADEDMFTHTIKQLDSNYASGKPFFSHIMTVSNHKPFTYPAGKIDIPPSTKSREGAVKYTDYAIGKFLKDVQSKPWFPNTIFVIVSDHCASAAGKTSLPVTGYHIPLLIYSPANIQPQKVDALMSQIDVAPTILGLLKFNYKSKFIGQDIFNLTKEQQRAFISTYQGLGYLKDGNLIVQSPLKQVKQYQPDFATGAAKEIPLDPAMKKKAMAYYQCAFYLLKNGLYKVGQ
jgi:phosphoglycerol transferase MdoB-like AlkP superfamily enzyme